MNLFKNFICVAGTIAFWSHKHWELQIYQTVPGELLNINYHFRFKGYDHAGPYFEIEMVGFIVSFQLYDDRHWNYDKNCWAEPHLL